MNYQFEAFCGVLARSVAVVDGSIEKSLTSSRGWDLGESKFIYSKGWSDSKVRGAIMKGYIRKQKGGIAITYKFKA